MHELTNKLLSEIFDKVFIYSYSNIDLLQFCILVITLF